MPLQMLEVSLTTLPLHSPVLFIQLIILYTCLSNMPQADKINLFADPLMDFSPHVKCNNIKTCNQLMLSVSSAPQLSFQIFFLCTLSSSSLLLYL